MQEPYYNNKGEVMVEIDFRTSIGRDKINEKTAEELEDFISSEIAYGLASEMKEHIDELSFIDMQMNTETGNFDITAELVLCAKAQIITTAEMQAQKLAAYGLTEAQILDVLETQLQDTKGF